MANAMILTISYACEVSATTTLHPVFGLKGIFKWNDVLNFIQARMSPRPPRCTSSPRTPRTMSPRPRVLTTQIWLTKTSKSRLQNTRLERSQKMKNPRRVQVMIVQMFSLIIFNNDNFVATCVPAPNAYSLGKVRCLIFGRCMTTNCLGQWWSN